MILRLYVIVNYSQEVIYFEILCPCIICTQLVKWNITWLLNAATLALRAVPVPDLAPTRKSRRSRMHLLHKAIASRAKARITAPKQSLELNMSLVASGTRILTYTASGGPGVPGRSPTGSRQIVRATVMVARNLRRKGKCDKLSVERRVCWLGDNDRCVTQLSTLTAIARLHICTDKL